MREYAFYKNYFEELVSDYDYTRRGKVFKTQEKYYYYDTGTGKVFECRLEIYEILKLLQQTNSFDNVCNLNYKDDVLLEALEELYCVVKSENILKAPLLKGFAAEQIEDLETSLEHGIKQVTFEVTQRCNLRCDYCIYQEDNTKFRGFYEKDDINFDIAKKVLDRVKDNVGKKFYCTFYGGEPLLNYQFIKQCVEYVQSLGLESEIFYSMTTNLTLMTKEIARFLASVPNFTVVCSIDGDQEIHDEHRKTIEGKGSFIQVMKGLKNLRNEYGHKDENIIVNMVLNPPYTKERFEKIQKFIDECPYLNENNNIMYSYVDYGTDYDVEELDRRLTIPDVSAFSSFYSPVQGWTKEKLSDISDPHKLFTWGNTLNSLVKLHKRKLSDTPMEKCYINGCCVPGGRRLYVTSAGEFQICERIGEAPIVGDADNGINLKAIQEKFINEYIEQSLPDCKKCWAVHLCGICYASCYNKEGLDLYKKRIRCVDERFELLDTTIIRICKKKIFMEFTIKYTESL